MQVQVQVHRSQADGRGNVQAQEADEWVRGGRG